MSRRVARAAAFATQAHHGQVDKAGEPYIRHPERVAARVAAAGGSEQLVVAAWLHDVVEDTHFSKWDLYGQFGTEVADVVDALTHRKGETRVDYLDRIRSTPGAALVKLADVDDNTDPARINRLDPPTQDRLRRKYDFTRRYLLTGEIPVP
jgi:(p)ppGpp synthase/HD superfamily hydrolase